MSLRILCLWRVILHSFIDLHKSPADTRCIGLLLWIRCFQILSDVLLTVPCRRPTCILFFFPSSVFLWTHSHLCLFSLRLFPRSSCFPQAPFSTVYDCRSIHSHSLSRSFAGCTPDHIVSVFISIPNMSSRNPWQPAKKKVVICVVKKKNKKIR